MRQKRGKLSLAMQLLIILLVCLAWSRSPKADQASTHKAQGGKWEGALSAGSSQGVSQAGEAAKLWSQGQSSALYYAQLSAAEKEMYQVLARTDLRTGKAVYRPNLRFYMDGTSVSSEKVQKTEPIQELFSMGEKAIYAYRLDEMQSVYWMYDCDINISWNVIPQEDGFTQVEVEEVTFSPIPYYSGVLGEDRRVEDALDAAVSVILEKRRNTSRLETLRAMLSFMSQNFNYGNLKSHPGHTPAGVLLLKYGRTGTCEGYARTFFILCKRFSIPVVYVESQTHAYNYVQMENGLWYGCDSTWADTGSEVDETWLLFGAEEVLSSDSSQTHVPSLTRCGVSLQAPSLARHSYPGS